MKIKRGKIRVFRKKGKRRMKIVTWIYGEETIDYFTFEEIEAVINNYRATHDAQASVKRI